MCLSKQVFPQNTVSCFVLFSVFACSQCFLAYAFYQLIMNSLCHDILPATKRRVKEDFHASFALTASHWGLSALQFDETTLWNTCPADVQLIAKSTNRSTKNITLLAKPPKTFSQYLLQQSVRDTNSKGGGSSWFCCAHLNHEVIHRSVSNTHIGVSEGRWQVSVGSVWKSIEVSQQGGAYERT